MRVASAFPPVARQWHVGRRSPLTVAGAAAALRHRPRLLAPRSLFTRRDPREPQTGTVTRPDRSSARSELSTDYESAREFDLACMLAQPATRHACAPTAAQKQNARESADEVEQQRFAAHGDEIERAGEQQAEHGKQRAAHAAGSSCRPASRVADLALRLPSSSRRLAPPAAPPGAPGSASAPRPRTGRARSRSTTSYHRTWWHRKDSRPATGRRTSPAGATGTRRRTASTSSGCRRRRQPGSRSAAPSTARTARAGC